MKNVFKFFAALVISTTFIGGVAGAATCTGTISVTGTGSNNQINCNEVNNIVVTCDNNVTVGTVNTQTGSSGSGDSSANTTGGNAVSGSVVNENGQDITIGASCGEAALTSNPGQGGGGGAGGNGGAGGAMPEILPNTSSDSFILPTALVGLLLSGAAVALMSRILKARDNAALK